MADDKKFDMPGSVSIVSTGRKEVKKEKFETVVDSLQQPSSVGQTLDDMYDRFSKLVYLIDASGSMGSSMLVEQEVPIEYEWNDEALEGARSLLLEALTNDDSIIDPDSGVELTEGKAKKLSVETLKKIVVEQGWEDAIGLSPVVGVVQPNRSGKSKMQAVKEAARDFVKKRFQKWPDAQVFLYAFEDHPRMLVGGVSEQGVLDGIDRLPDYGGGGTNIYAAVGRAVEHCKKRSSEVGAHHIVLVSDGMDQGARGVQGLLPDMKEIGIVFDFIFIQGGDSIEGMDDVIRILRDICEATGGEFTTVKTEKDFVQKFLAVSNRKCLPPAPQQMK